MERLPNRFILEKLVAKLGGNDLGKLSYLVRPFSTRAWPSSFSD